MILASFLRSIHLGFLSVLLANALEIYLCARVKKFDREPKEFLCKQVFVSIFLGFIFLFIDVIFIVLDSHSMFSDVFTLLIRALCPGSDPIGSTVNTTHTLHSGQGRKTAI